MDKLLGINTDVSPRNQIPGSYRFALNTVNNSKSGDMKSLSNEQGNEADVNTYEYFLPTGECYINSGESIIFFVGFDTSADYIRISKRVNGILHPLMYIKDTGWTTANQVKIEHKVVNGCEDVIIITDGVNPIRYINITTRENYLLTGETVTSANADGEGWDIGLMNINPSFTLPTLSSIEVLDTGGNLNIGSYIIVPQYLTEGLDPTSWLNHTGVIPIYDEPFLGDYTEIDGGNTTLVESTSKSIRVQFNNLDTSFSYLRLALISNIDGVLTSAIIATLPITGESLTYTITGYETFTSIALEALVVDNNIFESAEDIKLYDNRLWLINVKERQIDHSIFQGAAFNVKAHWFANRIDAEASGGNDTKSPVYYLDYRSYMRDETYAFGIQYRFKNGWLSPVYPLIGRPKDTGYYTALPSNSELNLWHNRLAPTTGWDSTLYEVGIDIPLADVEHLGFITGSEDIGDGPGLVQRWRVFNTATYDTSITASHFAAGEFAYTESTEIYPNNNVYGSNAGQAIRDFKFPDAILHQIGSGYMGGFTGATFELDDIASSYNIFPIGIKFTNVIIPTEYEDEIAGYEIVRVERNESNSTVLDKGILNKVVKTTFDSTTDENYIQQLLGTSFTSITEPDYTKSIDHQYQTFHNPLSKFRNITTGSYIKIEGEHLGREEPYVGTGGLLRTMLIPSDSGFGTRSFSETLYNRKIDVKQYVAGDTIGSGSLGILIDNTEQQEALYIKLSSALDYNKAVLVTTNYYLYASLKQELSSQYGAAEGRSYISTDSILHLTDECEIYGGDIFISPLNYRKCERMDSEYNPLNHHEEDADGISYTIHKRMLFKQYVESIINCNLRHEGADPEEIYYPKSHYESIQTYINQEGDWISDLIPNFYAYNDAFSQENSIKAYFGLPFNFNYNSDCLGEFPTRIACSEKDNIESSADSNKIFLPNNYRDLPKNKGIGLALHVRGDRLYAHMERTIYVIPIKDQAVRLGDINAYFGTGEVLSIPPSELVTTEKGYAGLSSKYSYVDTPYGAVFVSHEDKKVHMLSDSLEPITNLGISTWAFDNMKFNFIDDFRVLMGEANLIIPFERFRNNASPYGMGFHSTYDPRYDRVIITKRDYRIKFGVGIASGSFAGTYNSLILYPEGTIVYNDDDHVFELVTGDQPGLQVRTPINYYDTDYFEDCSFTISFSFLSKSWISFHSYIPTFYMFDKEQFYSFNYQQTKEDSIYIPDEDMFILYRHSSTADFQSFYSSRKPHIIDIILNANAPSNFTNIFLDTRASILETTYKEWYDVEDITFDSFIGYNTTQCTGEHNIVVLDNYNSIETWETNISYARRLNNIWRISNLRDLVSDRTIPYFTSQYSDIVNDYYIDKVLNFNALNYNTSQYQLKKMNDMWLGVRLIFDELSKVVNSPKIKLTTNIVETLNYQSR